MNLRLLLISLLLTTVKGVAQDVGIVNLDLVKVFPSKSAIHRALNKKTKKYGYVDERRRLALPFVYDRVWDFVQGYARVAIDNSYKIINEEGDITVDFDYLYLGDLIDNKCLAINESGKHGVINVKNDIIVPFVYDYIYSDNNRLFLCKIGDTKYIVTADTSFVLDRKVFFGPSSKGFLCLEDDAGYYVINNQGEIVQDSLDYVGDFETDYFKFRDDYLTGFLDNNGEILIPNIYENLGSFSEGLCAARIDGKWGYIDTTNTLVIEPMYSSAGKFHFGKTVVSVGADYFIIDRWGNKPLTRTFDLLKYFERDSIYKAKILDTLIIYNFEFERITDRFMKAMPSKSGYFENGLLLVEKDSLFGYLNKNGEVVVDFKYVHAEPFDGPFAAVGDDLVGLINSNGNEILQIQYDDIRLHRWSYLISAERNDSTDIYQYGGVKIGAYYGEVEHLDYGYLVLRQNNKYGLIRKTGEVIFNNRYDSIEIKEFSNGAVLKDSDGFGFYSFEKERIVLETLYDDIAPYYGGHSIIVEQNGKKGLFNVEGIQVLRPEYDDIVAMTYGVLVTKGDKFGLYTKDCKELIPIEYDLIKYLNRGRFEITKDGLMRVFDIEATNYR